jgi:multiple sugar transport system ATP-binding protein
MDEPLGTLDTEFRDLMCQELRQLHDRIGATTVYVTHDQVEAMSMGDHVAVMNQGEILQAGTPDEVYDRPSSLFVADFIGNPPMNMLPCQGPIAPGSDSVKVAGANVRIPALREGLDHDEGILGARPEHLRLSDEAELRGRIFGIEYTGARKIVAVDTDVGRVRVRAPNTVTAEVGDTVGLDFLTSRLSLFDAKSEQSLALAREGEAHG